jgi:hypothetical protein
MERMGEQHDKGSKQMKDKWNHVTDVHVIIIVKPVFPSPAIWTPLQGFQTLSDTVRQWGSDIVGQWGSDTVGQWDSSIET